uniref:Interferon-induced protein 44-like n=1 Tax=Nothobranchius furzeri TaxID=105023 RepID=A0A8C6PK09_NOTFU
GVTGAQTTIAPPVFSFPTASTGQPSTQPAALFSLSSQPKFSWRNQNEGEKPEEIPGKQDFCCTSEVPQARVLLLGPLHSGKSSFISSVQSLFNGRVSNRAMVGSFFPTSFTKKLQSFSIHTQKREENTGLVLCDIPGLGDGEVSGLTLHDILSVIKGHVPEGHKFSPGQPVVSETDGYVKSPSLKEKIHCVAFVVDASRITSYSKGLGSTFKQLREHISDLCVHQVALLTHVDKVCPKTARDVSEVYRSLSIKETMSKAGALLGMSTSYIVPVKNYSSELDLDVNTDVLLLSAVDHILNYADLFFQDHIDL